MRYVRWFVAVFFVSLSAVLTGDIRLTAGGVPPLQTQPAPSPQTPRALLNQYCVTCHNARLRTAGLALDTADVEHVGADAALWEKVAAKLNANAMPPAGRPRPSDEVRRAFITSLETQLDLAAAANPRYGRTATFHRLNRTEYQNAIRDLLALEIDATQWFPGDDAAYGFDNNAGVLTMSSTLLDGYLSAANKVSSLVVGDLSMPPVLSAYKFAASLLQQGRISDDLPLGAQGGVAVRHYFPLDGQYEVTLHVTGGPGPTERVELRLDGVAVGEIGGTAAGGAPPDPDAAAGAATAGPKIRFSATAGSHALSAVFIKPWQATEGQFPAFLPWGNSALTNVNGARQYLHVNDIEIVGPSAATGSGDTPSRRKIFLCRPTSTRDEAACASRILTTLTHRAYRRPLQPGDVDTVLAFYKKRRAEGGSFDAGIQAGVERLLVDPDFLYRIEPRPVGANGTGNYRLSDVALASRLSFFLWSSIPDDELLALAERGALKDPAVLEQQTRRMLADPRASALVTSFGSQWLFQRNLREINPDSYQFPDWDENLRQSMARETEMFLDSQIRADRPIPELLTADYTFLNDRLARHYGIAGVSGSQFRRVTLTDPTRRGLLGQGSLLTVTSRPNRTSPVLRGKWLLENMLGYPTPAPPPNVPALPENERGKETRSVRQQIEEHRKNPACASCHAVMDPIGFSLDQFDAIGRWRTTDGGTPVDATGSLPDGRKVEGVNGLRQLIVGEPQKFVRTITEKLLTYSLGRGVEFYEMPTVRRITQDAAATNYRWSSIVVGIVKSQAFQTQSLGE